MEDRRVARFVSFFCSLQLRRVSRFLGSSPQPHASSRRHGLSHFSFCRVRSDMGLKCYHRVTSPSTILSGLTISFSTWAARYGSPILFSQAYIDTIAFLGRSPHRRDRTGNGVCYGCGKRGSSRSPRLPHLFRSHGSHDIITFLGTLGR